MKRADYEQHVVRTMILMFCTKHHSQPCAECAELADYCAERIRRCPLGSSKTSCRKCTIHCYDEVHRERIRTVMRYSGPRLMFSHPLMALRHILYEKF